MAQTVVRLLKNWDFPDWRRQTPFGSGVWEGVKFTEEPVEAPDYVLVLNQPKQPVDVYVAPNRVWAIIQEPPTAFHRFLHRGQHPFARIYTTDPRLATTGGRYRASQPALPWHVGRSFDELTKEHTPLPKSGRISCVTSTLAFLPGHRRRLDYVRRILDSGRVDFFGRGLRPIADKLEALAPYRYSIVLENHSGPGYWTEKLTDCYLAGTMPIYFGCPDIEFYFPKSSFIRLDIDHPNPVAFLDAILADDIFERSQPALTEAKHRCLFQHQLCALIAREISTDTEPPQPPQRVHIASRKELNPILRMSAIWYFKLKPLLRQWASR
jgi:Glycosyltransferase family 10 (fucosyltransferase) C-term